MLDYLSSFFAKMKMLVRMQLIAVIVNVSVLLLWTILPQYLEAQCKQYHSNQKFHRESQLIWNDKFETNHSYSNK